MVVFCYGGIGILVLDLREESVSRGVYVRFGGFGSFVYVSIWEVWYIRVFFGVIFEYAFFFLKYDGGKFGKGLVEGIKRN